MIRIPALQRSLRGTRSSISGTAPAPIGGWNTKDPEAAMPKQDARWLENWWPSTTDVTVRKGASNHVTGITGAVRSLMAYSSPTASKLFAATATAIYDVTFAGTVGASVNTITNGDFRHILFTVAGGTYIIAVNGVDKLRLYNGTAWTAIDGASTPAITGLATTSLDSVCAFKRRLWFVQKDSMSAWYLPVNVIGGALTEFPLGQLFTRGGKLIAMASWTVDAGNGVDDYAVFITTEGECAVYKGVDPASATDWNLVGVYYVGKPVGKQCVVKFGGDLLLLTEIGLLPFSKAFNQASVSKTFAVSDKINSIFSESVRSYGSLYGWKCIVHPSENALLVNVPTTEDSAAKQFAMNTSTNAWALFSGWNAVSWEVLGNDIYFGGNGYIAKAFSGNNDFDANIVATAKTAFTYLSYPGYKHFKLIRPILKSSSAVNVELALDTDFNSEVFGNAIAFAAPLDYVWDTATWDSGLWADDYTVRQEWRTVFAKGGFCVSVCLRIASKDIIIGWSSTDFLYQRGEVL